MANIEIDEPTTGQLPHLAASHLGPTSAALLSRVEPSVRLRRTKPCAADGRASRLGGTALLPADHPWPVTDAGEPLSFLGQINTNEIGTLLPDPPLLADTLLSFFYDAEEQRGWGFDPAHAQYWRVVAATLSEANAATAPVESLTFPSFALAPSVVTTVPDRWEPPIEALWNADGDAVDELYEQLDGGYESTGHRMFGWPDLIQRGMRLECQLAANGIDAGSGNLDGDPRVDVLRAGADDWRLLLQLETDEETGWFWVDGGRLYYWIRIQDLRAGRFDRVWMILQTT